MTLTFGLMFVVGSALAQDPAKVPTTAVHAQYADRAGLATTASHMMCDGTVVDGCTITQLQEKLKELQKKFDALPTATASAGTGGPSTKTMAYRVMVDKLVIEMGEVKQRLDTIAGRPSITSPAVPGETPAPAVEDTGLIGAMQAQITAMQEALTALQAQMATVPAPAPVTNNVTNVTQVNNLDGVHIVLGVAFGPTLQATVGGRAAPVSTNLSASFGVIYAKDGRFVQAEVAPQVGYWDTYGVSTKLALGGQLGGDDSGLTLAGVVGYTTCGIQADLSQRGADVAYNGIDLGGRFGVSLSDDLRLTGTFTFQPFYSVVGFVGSDHLYGTGFMQPTGTIGLQYVFGQAKGDDKPKAEKPEQAAKVKKTEVPSAVPPEPAPEAVPAKTEAPEATPPAPPVAPLPAPADPAVPPATPPASPWTGDPDAQPVGLAPAPPETKLP